MLGTTLSSSRVWMPDVPPFRLRAPACTPYIGCEMMPTVGFPVDMSSVPLTYSWLRYGAESVELIWRSL